MKVSKETKKELEKITEIIKKTSLKYEEVFDCLRIQFIQLANEYKDTLWECSTLIQDLDNIIKDEESDDFIVEGIIDSYQHDKNEKRINNIIGEYK